MKKQMKVLNIAQPNAHNVIFNGKNIENRNMQSHYRGTIAIYASQTILKSRFTDQTSKPIVKEEDCSFGYIIGIVDLVDCIKKKDLTAKLKKWFHGPYGYVLKNPTALKSPVKVKPPNGAVIWWNLEGSNLKKVIEQVPLRRKIIPLANLKDIKLKK